MNIFDNTKTAFELKSDSELERAFFLFKLIQSQPMVRIGTTVTNFALKAHLPVEGLIRSTVFDHFCGGVTEEDCMENIDKMYQKGVFSVLDYSVEEKKQRISLISLNKTLKSLEFCKEKESIPFVVFKPTGVGRFALYQKISEKKELTTDEKSEWTRVVKRFVIICEKAHEYNVPILIDAEESWMQDAADHLIEELMEEFNKKRAIVFNTLQMYRHDRMDYLKQLHQRAREKDFYIGLKVVRGAYMEKERDRAQEKGYPSPICIDKQATDSNYDEAIVYMMKNKKMALFAGTHNEESSYKLIQLAKQHNISNWTKRHVFRSIESQLSQIKANMVTHSIKLSEP